MKYLKRFFKSFIISFSLFIFLLLFFTLLSYLNILTGKGIIIINLLIPIISMFVGSIYFRRKKGWLDGLCYGSMVLFLLLLINLVIYKGFFTKSLIYYGILLISSILGGSLNKKNKKA